jgi:acetoin utilization protein AcuC
MQQTVMMVSEQLARYGFGDSHPFGPDRLAAFLRELNAQPWAQTLPTLTPRAATYEELLLFHTPAHVEHVRELSAQGQGFFDAGDTPVFRGAYEAAALIVGATLVAGTAIVKGEYRRAFVPIAGLHHAARDRAAGFCIFNDCGVLIEALRRDHGITRIAYVDIDAHHGDGVFYAFEDDPALIFADIHQDGATLYPGTGASHEQGTHQASGTKLNIPLPPGAGDAEFAIAWAQVVAHLKQHRPEFIILQCGADSVQGDPLTQLCFSAQAHGTAAYELRCLAEELGHGRVLALGGGGYNRDNLARAWVAVLDSLAR